MSFTSLTPSKVEQELTFTGHLDLFSPNLICPFFFVVIYVFLHWWALLYSFSSVQLLSCVRLFSTPWIAAHQASLSFTNSQSLLKLMSIKSWSHPTISSSVLPFSSCLQSFLASGYFPVSQFFASGESFSFNIIPSNECSGLNFL